MSAIWLSISTDLKGQQTVIPESVGMSSARLSRITKEAEQQVADGKLVGIVSLVARRGKIVYLEAVGYQDREEAVRMETNTIFRIASMTKPVTSLAALMLYEEGEFQLTDPVSKYIPEFGEMKVALRDGQLVDAKRQITIYDLLTHNSGLGYPTNVHVGKLYDEARIAGGGGLGPDEDLIGVDVRKLAEIPLAQQPGSGWQYGFSIDVLGHVIEEASDQTLAEFFHERFFNPLGMQDTKFYLDKDEATRLAQMYIRDDSGQLLSEDRQEAVHRGYRFGGKVPIEGPRVCYAGGGGLCSTVEDYFRFCQMVLQYGEYGGKRYLSRKTIEQASYPHLPIPGGEFRSISSDFGLGFAVHKNTGTPRPGTPGTLRWGSIFNGGFFIDPEEELIGITLAQLFPGELDWQDKFEQLAFSAIDD
jgi:CubicO group peptidase (beta-lactamase class C family)